MVLEVLGKMEGETSLQSYWSEIIEKTETGFSQESREKETVVTSCSKEN